MSNYSRFDKNMRPGMKRPQINFNINSKAKKPFDGFRRMNSIEQQRTALPIFKVRKRLLTELEKSQTIILIGETGSGKTTQIPQYIHEIRLQGDGIVAITQPRRVAAITVAHRVAVESKTSLGETVGYCVRFDDTTSASTKIKYLTDGMLLREALIDDCLKAYTVIILDEAHERTIHTDVLFGIVKEAQKKRATNSFMKPLKVIVMSATMDVDHFHQYFDNAPVIYLEGRQYPVEVNHAAEPQEDYIFSCLVTIFQIHKVAPANHDILVFLTGQEEIETMAASIRAIQKDEQCTGPNIRVFPLYAALSAPKQQEIFQPCNSNTRKIILSTNIAETSVTIPGIKYVIDSGMVKQKIHLPSTGLDVLRVQSISQAQAWQRTGRAGRESEGYCYRTYTQAEFDTMIPNTVPEILRSNLSSVILQLLALKLDVLKFDFLDKPSTDLTLEGLELLKLLEAVDDVKEPELTQLGKQMSFFPLDPRFSKVLISAKTFDCLDEVLTIIALLSGESIFVNNVAKREEAAAARAKFASSAGDLITLLNIFRAYNPVTGKHAWCYENFLSGRNLEYATKVRKQLFEICEKCGISVSSCGEDVDKVRKCFISGFFMNVAELQRDKKYVTVGKRQMVNIHPTSVLAGSFPPLVLFTELVQTGKCYMRYVTPVDPQWVEEISPKGHKFINISEVD